MSFTLDFQKEEPEKFDEIVEKEGGNEVLTSCGPRAVPHFLKLCRSETGRRFEGYDACHRDQNGFRRGSFTL